MDPVRNPFAPGAGTRPPELAGREELLLQAELLLARVQSGRAEKSMVMTGLRGVGKTVVLNEIRARADRAGFWVVQAEAPEGSTLANLITPPLRKILLELSPLQKSDERIGRALRAFRSWMGTPQVTINDVTWGIAPDPLPGVADSGTLLNDLPDLLIELASAAQARGTGVAILIDEVQYLSEDELAALIVALHQVQQRSLPLLLAAAGLPTVPALAGQAKSYSERLLSFPILGSLDEAASAAAIREPLLDEGADIEPQAIELIHSFTQGYPYFIQEWGYACWQRAEGPVITAGDAAEAEPEVLRRLDEGFFRVRFDRLSPSEKAFLRAMADLGPGPIRTQQAAEALGRTLQSIGPVRAKLIAKGMAYSPGYGEISYTVPLFGEFMKRIMP